MGMGKEVRSTVANVLRTLIVLYLLFLWTVVLNPFRWEISFPGGLRGGTITMLLAIVASSIAAGWGKKVWLLVTARATVLTFIYMGFFYKMPLIY
jgi:hypothetical protein